MKTQKHKKSARTKTHKANKKLLSLEDQTKDVRCRNYNHNYNTFEDKIDLVYGDIFASKDFNLEKTIIKELRQAVSPSNITPREDFYSYINERWMKKEQVDPSQKYIVQVDDFRLVQDKVYKQLLKIVKEFVTTNKSPKSVQLNNFYKSQLKLNTDQETRRHATETLARIDDFRKDKDNLYNLLAMANENEIVSWGSPFLWSLNPDDKDPKIFRSFLDGPQLSLLDYKIYYDDGTDIEYKNKYRRRFQRYLKDLFQLAFGENHGFNLDDVFTVEVKLATAISCYEIKGPIADSTYNRITTSQSLSTYKFDWSKFSKAIGFSSPPAFFITGNVNYIKCGTQLLLEEWDSDIWRTYWIYIFIRQQIRWNAKGRVIAFEFFGNFMRGQQVIVDRELSPVYSLGFAFNNLLTNEYIRLYENKQTVQYVKTMAEDLKTVFIRIIKRNKWLQPKTKIKALKKLTHFNLEVGSPQLLQEDPCLQYSDHDAWGNLKQFSEWRHQKAIKLDGKPILDIAVMDWAQVPPKFIGTQAYVVNASYTPAKNGIYIPLGYIQKPFVDLEERGIEYNLAHIGFTLGHEMSHSLDDWGSQYDENGVLKNWWTEKDKKKYKLIQDDVIKQYETFAAYDGIKFDASMSIGEDLADISGLTICREYLRDFQLKNEDILPIQALSYEAFFVYYAYQQRQKIGKKAIEAQLKSNPHPLDKYRTNVPLSRLPLFREIYKIKKGDKMWWHSTNRVWE